MLCIFENNVRDGEREKTKTNKTREKMKETHQALLAVSAAVAGRAVAAAAASTVGVCLQVVLHSVEAGAGLSDGGTHARHAGSLGGSCQSAGGTVGLVKAEASA